MKTSEAIKWIDNRMCSGRGQWTEHHQPIIDEPWQAGRMAIEALQNSHWIPCSERLPEEETDVLVTRTFLGCKDGSRGWNAHLPPSTYVEVAQYFNGEWFALSDEYKVARSRHTEPVAWMPLPEPYREEKMTMGSLAEELELGFRKISSMLGETRTADMSEPIEDVPDQTAKADAGKIEPMLVPPELIEDVAEVRRYGNQKYHDPENWKSVEVERYWNALFRHLLACMHDRHSVDPESGIENYKHMACNIGFICALERRRNDERTNRQSNQPRG